MSTMGIVFFCILFAFYNANNYYIKCFNMMCHFDIYSVLLYNQSNLVEYFHKISYSYQKINMSRVIWALNAEGRL